VRVEGSGNVGATNVLRAAGKTAGVLALLLDVAKGIAPVVLGRLLGASPTVLALSAVAVVVGHIHPVFLGFRGGKGVATAAGVGFCLAPLVTLSATAIFFATVAVTRFVSVGSIAAAVSLPVLAHLSSRLDAVGSVGFESQLAFAIIAVMVVGRHRSNIRRLVAGTESRLEK
jgi:glycerol-3-phosphate acyltransferase PlsY